MSQINDIVDSISSDSERQILKRKLEKLITTYILYMLGCFIGGAFIGFFFGGIVTAYIFLFFK